MVRDRFDRFTARIVRVTGSPVTFLAALLSILAWAALGPWAGYSEMWQLTVNTGTTIITFLMVFLIQSAQNRDSKALHLKLDELISATEMARNAVIRIEEGTSSDLERVGRERDSSSGPGCVRSGMAEYKPTDPESLP